MKIFSIVFISLVVMWIIDFIRWAVTRKEVKKKHVEMLEAWVKLENALKSDLTEIKSAKRWMREVLKQLEK